MFKEEVTQYCPMCEEWAEKYEKLNKECDKINLTNERLVREKYDLHQDILKYKQALQDIKELVKKDYCSEIESCEFCAEIGNCINRKILQKCEDVL